MSERVTRATAALSAAVAGVARCLGQACALPPDEPVPASLAELDVAFRRRCGRSGPVVRVHDHWLRPDHPPAALPLARLGPGALVLTTIAPDGRLRATAAESPAGCCALVLEALAEPPDRFAVVGPVMLRLRWTWSPGRRPGPPELDVADRRLVLADPEGTATLVRAVGAAGLPVPVGVGWADLRRAARLREAARAATARAMAGVVRAASPLPVAIPTEATP